MFGPNRQIPQRSRRAFALSPFIILLAAALIILIGWKAYIILDHIPPNAPFAARAQSKVITDNLVSALMIIAIAGGVGAACYFAFAKSDRAANLGMGLVVFLGVGTYSFQLYSYLTKTTTGGPGPATVATTPQSAVDLLNEATRENQRQVDAAKEKMRAQMEAQAERTRAAAEAARKPPIFPGTHPTPASPLSNTPGPTPAPPIRPPSPTTSTPNSPTSPDPRPTAREPKPADPAITQALDGLKTDITKQIDDLLGKAKTLVDSVDKPPPRSMPVMDKRVADAKQLKADAQALSKRLRAFDTEAEKALDNAGLDKKDSFHERVRFVAEYRASSRAFSCDEYGRMCDDITAESELLKRGFNNWKYDASGNITSKDKSLEFEARAIRSRLEMSLKRADDIAQRIRGD